MEKYLEGTSRMGLLLNCSGILAKSRRRLDTKLGAWKNLIRRQRWEILAQLS